MHGKSYSIPHLLCNLAKLDNPRPIQDPSQPPKPFHSVEPATPSPKQPHHPRPPSQRTFQCIWTQIVDYLCRMIRYRTLEPAWWIWLSTIGRCLPCFNRLRRCLRMRASRWFWNQAYRDRANSGMMQHRRRSSMRCWPSTPSLLSRAEGWFFNLEGPVFEPL